MDLTWRSVFTPRDRRPTTEWAHDYVWLEPPITKTGWFTCADSRHFLAIFASLDNDHKREVNVLKPVRGGGSLIGDVFCPRTIAVDPGPYMDVFQTDQVASDHAEERIKRIFERCKPVAALFPANRHKERDDEILFSNGHTWYVRGPSLGNLQAKGIRYLRLEEVWMWAQGKMGEAMALGALRHSKAQLAVAVTGVAGPGGGSPSKPVGSVWFGFALRGQGPLYDQTVVHSELKRFEGDREAVRVATVNYALTQLLVLSQNSP